jgi:hypothetical protein
MKGRIWDIANNVFLKLRMKFLKFENSNKWQMSDGGKTMSDLVTFIVTWKIIAQVCGACPDSSHTSGAYQDGPVINDAVACCNDETRSADREFSSEIDAHTFIKNAPPNTSEFHLYKREELKP